MGNKNNIKKNIWEEIANYRVIIRPNDVILSFPPKFPRKYFRIFRVEILSDERTRKMSLTNVFIYLTIWGSWEGGDNINK